MKVAINECYGGFSLSPLATEMLATLKGRKCYFFLRDHKLKKYIQIKKNDPKGLFWVAFDTTKIPEKMTNKWYEKHVIEEGRSIERHDPDLIYVIEALGSEGASGDYAKVVIAHIPDGIEYFIEEYDGMESVAESHRKWYGTGEDMQHTPLDSSNPAVYDRWVNTSVGDTRSFDEFCADGG